MIVAKRLLQGLDDLPAMLRLFHVDEIDDDDAAQIAQAQLPRDGHRRLEIGSENGLLEIPVPDEGAGIDVDGRHRLRLIDDQVAAGFQRHFAIQGLLDFLLDVMQFEYRARLDVKLDPRQNIGHESARELAASRDVRSADRSAPRSTSGRSKSRRMRRCRGRSACTSLPGLGAQSLVPHELPQLAQIHHIGAQAPRAARPPPRSARCIRRIPPPRPRPAPRCAAARARPRPRFAPIPRRRGP